jgi:spore coat polysaccharide biosynthesis predicted glycosyltransferase SpsG
MGNANYMTRLTKQCAILVSKGVASIYEISMALKFFSANLIIYQQQLIIGKLL